MTPSPRNPERLRSAPSIVNAPCSVEAEQAVLGACLVNADCASEVLARLQVDDFWRPVNRTILRAIEALVSRNEPVDYVTVLETIARLRLANNRKPEREQVELVDVELEYLTELAEFVPTSANFAWYCETIRRHAEAREVMRATRTAHTIAAAANPNDALATLEEAAAAIRARRFSADAKPIGTVLGEVSQKWGAILTGKSTAAIATGLESLDAIIGGHRPGELTILAGRPSAGKSSLAAKFALHAALTLGVATQFFSSEMGRVQIGETMIGAEARVDVTRIARKLVSDAEYDRLVEAGQRISAAPLLIDDTPRLTVAHVQAAAKRNNSGLVVVDYLQRMAPSGRNPRATRDQQIAEICSDLKNFARESKIPVIVLAALSRAGEKEKTPRRPRMSDLRECGQIEFEADTLLLLWRPFKAGVPGASRTLAECVVEKQREGPASVVVELRFVEEFRRFESTQQTGDDSDSLADERQGGYLP